MISYDFKDGRICTGAESIPVYGEYDVVVVYGNAPAHKVAQTVEEETAKGNRTLAVKSDDDSLKAKKRIVL